MQRLLMIGQLTDQQIQTLMGAVRQLPAVMLSVYGPNSQRSAWLQATNWITGELTDQPRLIATMRKYDGVFVQLDSKWLVAQTQLMTSAGQAAGINQLILKSDASVLTLTQTDVHWYHQFTQRRQIRNLRLAERILQQSSLDFTWIQGQAAADSAIYSRALSTIWATAVPARRTLNFEDVLTVDLNAPAVA